MCFTPISVDNISQPLVITASSSLMVDGTNDQLVVKSCNNIVLNDLLIICYCNMGEFWRANHFSKFKIIDKWLQGCSKVFTTGPAKIYPHR